MGRTAPDKSLAVIDGSVREYKGEGVYMFSVGTDTVIKRLRLELDGTYRVISDNPDKLRYENYEITKDKLQAMKIYGEMVWNFEGHEVK